MQISTPGNGHQSSSERTPNGHKRTRKGPEKVDTKGTPEGFPRFTEMGANLNASFPDATRLSQAGTLGADHLRFDFLVTPGPMVTTQSLVEGFPSQITAGQLSCWNITLRDAPGRKGEELRQHRTLWVY